MKRCCVFCALFFSVLFTSGVGLFAGEKIVLSTLEWEPYIGSRLKDQGYVAEIVREAFRRQGYETEFRFFTWSRTLAMAETPDYAGYFPEYYASGLEEKFILSDPFPGGDLGFFALKSRHITYKTLEDLIPYEIGVVRGYVNTQEFDRADYLRKDEAVDDLTNIRKLLGGRLDLIVADEYVGFYLYRLNFVDRGELEFISPPLEEKDLHVAFQKDHPKSGIYSEAFRRGLSSMFADGYIEDILAKHGLK